MASRFNSDVVPSAAASHRSFASSAIPPHNPNVRHRCANLRTSTSEAVENDSAAPVANPTSNPRRPPIARPSTAGNPSPSPFRNGPSSDVSTLRSSSVHVKTLAKPNPSRAGSKSRIDILPRGGVLDGVLTSTGALAFIAFVVSDYSREFHSTERNALPCCEESLYCRR